MNDFLYACLAGASAALCFFAIVGVVSACQQEVSKRKRKMADAAYWRDCYYDGVRKYEMRSRMWEESYGELADRYIKLKEAKQNG